MKSFDITLTEGDVVCYWIGGEITFDGISLIGRISFHVTTLESFLT